MRQSYRPAIPPKPPPYRTQLLDHLGLVAGMFAALGLTEVSDQATQHNPARRLGPAGPAVTAMGLNGLGFRNHQLSLVPHFFQPKPRARLMAPGMHARPLPDAPLGRARETRSEPGLTAL